jgi:hypothetical protein
MAKHVQTKTSFAIKKRGLVSLMNKTKWHEVAEKMSCIGTNGPICRYKCISEDTIYGPSHIVWHEFTIYPTQTYEWLEIYRCEKIHRGALVAPFEIDYSEQIQKMLKDIGVMFSHSENGFKIWGYVDPSKQPAYVY